MIEDNLIPFARYVDDWFQFLLVSDNLIELKETSIELFENGRSIGHVKFVLSGFRAMKNRIISCVIEPITSDFNKELFNLFNSDQVKSGWGDCSVAGGAILFPFDRALKLGNRLFLGFASFKYSEEERRSGGSITAVVERANNKSHPINLL